MDNQKLIKKFLRLAGFKEYEGFAIDTESMNPDDIIGESYWYGKTLEDAIKGHYRKTTFWGLEEMDEVCYEDPDEAIDMAEDTLNMTFDDFKKNKRYL